MTDPILEVAKLGVPWVTVDPFLFCVHHLDAYPAGNEQLGPAASLEGRDLGQDFAGISGWRMYHGTTVPGFPQHPHRGFETVTIVRQGVVDHADSLGAAARYGAGDVQWLTAGAGIVHSEMFPLLRRDAPNPLELFQIWLNLPRTDKLAPPHFSMLWRDMIPKVREGGAEVAVVAGHFGGARAPAPPPRSWAARDEADVAIWTVDLELGATLTLPPAARGPSTRRVLYFYRGRDLRVGDHVQREPAALVVRGDREIRLEAAGKRCELLVLQGRPIGEPVVQYGPFVMNSPAEIRQAFLDYRATAFGGWPWPEDGPVHARHEGRFARHADGRLERVGA
jgi:redox-sensitive bicupin YhaK (pirin superfamily)